MNSLENRLGAMLEERSHHSPNGPDLDAVLRQSGRIKRRRTTAAAAGVVAAVALAIGVPYAALEHDVAPRPSQPSLSPPTSLDADSAPNLAALPEGSAPAMSWWRGTQVNQRDGSTATLPRVPKGTQYWGVSSYRGGWLTTRSLTLAEQNDATSEAIVETFDASGKSTGRTRGSGRLLISPDGTQVAWWTADQRLHVETTNGHSESGQSYRTDLNGAQPAGVHPLGFTQSGEIVYTAFEHDGQPDLRVTEGADRVRDLKGFDRVQAFDPAQQLIAGSVLGESAEQGRVATLDGTVVWTSERWKPLAFSIDGSKLLAVSTQENRINDYAVLDASNGTVVKQMSFDMVDLVPAAWKFENDKDVIFVVTNAMSVGRHPAAALIRWRADGSVERVTGISRSPQDGPAIQFGTLPSDQ